MIHATLLKNGIPYEETWMRYFFLGDSIQLYKGILLEGGSKSLVGSWTLTTTIPDSSGNKNVYGYQFSNAGLLIQTGPQNRMDTSRYTFDATSINVSDYGTGKTKLRLGYEIHGGRLSLYNLDTGKKMFRTR
jgi:hypothetical protein